jgi:hypothetical protein
MRVEKCSIILSEEFFNRVITLASLKKTGRVCCCLILGIHCFDKWLFKNDVTALGGSGYQGCCNDSTKTLELKSVTMGGGQKISNIA